MKEIKDISETIQYDISDTELKITLKAHQYKLDNISQYETLLTGQINMLNGEIIDATEEKMIISYQKDQYAENVAYNTNRATHLERMKLAQKMNMLCVFQNTTIQPFIHPENIFLVGEEVLIGHRGFMTDVVPYIETEENFFKQYRALILYILQPKYNYEDLIEGAGTLQDTLSIAIQEATSINEIHKIVSTQAVVQQKKFNKQSKLVKKRDYDLFKWGSLVLLILTIVFTTLFSIDRLKNIPLKNRVIEAESEFIANNYSKVSSLLKDDKPESLPAGAQYVYAVSSIELDSLSNEQKESILNNISQKSNENTLLYWIYIGKGNYEKALDIAKNIGDDQYILHAYTKLYDATKINTKMSGEKKQEDLKKYEEEISKYMKLLKGETDDTGETDGSKESSNK